MLGIAGVLQTIPSIALLGFMIPLLGIGPLPAITALFLYALLPVIRNTYTGINGVDPGVREAAVAMGMTAAQRLFRVDLVLAFPVIMAGIRTATVINVGVGTLAAYIAAGGLGEFIFGGIALNNTNMILAGAIPAALLAIGLDFLLSRLQRTGTKGRVAALAFCRCSSCCFRHSTCCPLAITAACWPALRPNSWAERMATSVCGRYTVLRSAPSSSATPSCTRPFITASWMSSAAIVPTAG